MSTYKPRAVDPVFSVLELKEALEWFRAEAPGWAWKWASSFEGGAEHMYVIKGKQLSEADYERAFRLTMALGEPHKFYRRTNIELHLPDLAIPFGKGSQRQPVTGMKFWPMTNRTSVSKAFNMAPVTYSYGDQDAPSTFSMWKDPFDMIAADWDDMIDERLGVPYETGDRAQRIAMWKLITGNRDVPTLLDLGSRTGFTLDAKIRPTRQYTAVDPSQGMMNQLVYKHPWVRDLHVESVNQFLEGLVSISSGSLGDVGGKLLRQWDTVASLEGSASFIHPANLDTALEAAARKLVLVHYDEGANTGLVQLPEYADESRLAAQRIPGARLFRMPGYQITVVTK